MGLLNGLKSKIGKIGISARITLFFSALLLVTLSITGIVYQRIYADIMLKKVTSVSMQTLQSINSNVTSLLATVNNYSKLILASPYVRNTLKDSDAHGYFENRRKLGEFMETVMSSFFEISSLYIVDNFGNTYFRDKFPNHFNTFNSAQESVWWNRAAALNGGSYVILNGADAFNPTLDENFISNIRIINNIEDQKPIGAVIINISERLFIKAYEEIAKNYETEIIILDENNNNIISKNDISRLKIVDFLKEIGDKDSYSKLNRKDNILYSYFKVEEYDWKIFSLVPYREIEKESQAFIIATFVIILVIAALILIGSVIIAGMITKPINILVRSMRKVVDGNLEDVRFNTSIYEFVRLRDGYNLMTEEIKSLLQKVVEEEKMKRKAEMDILQAQIKPHFLYNTFDSISALALMGRNEDVYKMMTALGSFYRISLSKGREIITISEELETVRSYLDILKIRYDQVFTASYDLDEKLSSFKIVKLVLQPFVENALYHGIKLKGEHGKILIKTWREDDKIKLMVMDDGIGMEQEQVDSILEDIKSNRDSASFGIKGTVQRLRLFYGYENVCSIISRKGAGTKVIITIPIPESGVNSGNK